MNSNILSFVLLLLCLQCHLVSIYALRPGNNANGRPLAPKSRLSPKRGLQGLPEDDFPGDFSRSDHDYADHKHPKAQDLVAVYTSNPAKQLTTAAFAGKPPSPVI